MLDYNKLYEVEDSFSVEKPVHSKLREFKGNSYKKVRTRNQTRFIKENDDLLD